MNDEVDICPHCKNAQHATLPQSFRRFLVFAIMSGFFLIFILALINIINLIQFDKSWYSLISIAIGMWGIAYVGYLCISFSLIGFLRLPGCEFVTIPHVLFRKRVHICVDTALNAVLDTLQKKTGLSFLLMKTESAQKWVLGLILQVIFLLIIASDVIGKEPKLILVGILSSVYFTYDKTVHRDSIGCTDLTGSGDYAKIIKRILSS